MSRDTSFYYSFLVLPPRKRHAIIAVWDFCRAVDDAVDEVVPEDEWAGGLPPAARAQARSELARWREELAAVYERTPSTPQGVSLQRWVREFNLPRRRFEELIDGVEMDLERTRYSTFDDLVEYCRRVASAVGLVCIEIFGYRDPAALVYAERLGLALQLTNIIRDIKTDLRRGRVYLPLEDLERFGVDEEDLGLGEMAPHLVALLRFECERARGFYEQAAEALPAADARSLLAAEIMGAIYYAILRRIEQTGYDVFSARVRVPRARRALIALRLWVATLFGLRSTRSTVVRPGGSRP